MSEQDAPGGSAPGGRSGERWLGLAVAALVVQSAWLAARAEPTVFHYAQVAAHFGVGLLLVPALIRWAARCSGRWTAQRVAATSGAAVMGLAALLALALFAVGNTRPHRWLLQAHVAFACAAVVLLALAALLRARSLSPRALGLAAAAVAGTLALGALALMPRLRPEPPERIANPALPPATMEDEAMGGAGGPFYPSSIRTTSGGRIPSDFFLGSEGCGRAGCHPDITAQWRSSAHHFASFNNQFYRKSIEYMQSIAGVQSSKWCAGCHDVALLLDGKFERPIADTLRENPDLPEAHAGLACTACHAITKVHGGTMGQGGYTLEYPPLHDLATSDNALLRLSHDLLLRLDPEPHGKTFLKPFHSQQHAEFCSSCHKVHLDIPVNSYRWVRGFNDYDNWQASGVSGQGARAFYYPEKPADCVDCHMPLVESKDKGNKKGRIHEHRFAAANSALATVNEDAEQLQKVQAFLKDKVTVDVFALTRTEGPGEERALKTGAQGPELAAHFPSGEEQDMPGPALVSAGGPAEVIAPLSRAGAAVRRGESVRVDVVVRTRGVGHFFPGGTVDAFDVWVELKAVDETGRVLFWSGRVEDDGKGPVEKGAHFYRSLMVDEHGNPINKRNAWAARAVVYARLVPPGAADTVRYRLEIPQDCGNEITLEASLHYRKFAHQYTQFAYAGEPAPGSETASVAKGHDDRAFAYTADTSGVSGKIKQIPDLPIITLNSNQARLAVVDAGAPLPATAPSVAEDRGRWNDYGIGFLLAGDLTAALHAFEKVCELDPAYADGFVNVARVRVREGDAQAALAALAKAEAIKPGLARAQFLEGQALKLEGRLEEARAAFERASAQFPRDRVVLNELARASFLLKDHAKAVEWGRKVLEVDPEDVRAHYTLMLASRGLGDEAAAKEHEQRYLRFKADEDAQLLTGEYRRLHPEDNNERQPIHEHVSVALDAVAPAATLEKAGQ